MFDYYSNPSIFARKVLFFDRKILKRVHRLLRGVHFVLGGANSKGGAIFLAGGGNAQISGSRDKSEFENHEIIGFSGNYRSVTKSLPDNFHSLYFHLNPADTVPLFIALQIALDDTPHSCDAIFKLGYVLIYFPSSENCSTVLLCFSDIF